MENFNQDQDRRQFGTTAALYPNTTETDNNLMKRKLEAEKAQAASERTQGYVGQAVCAAESPGAYQASKTVFLDDLRHRKQIAIDQGFRHQQHASENFDKANKLERAITIITLHPEYETLLELLRLV